MKRILVIFTAIILLASCSQSNENSNNPAEDTNNLADGQLIFKGQTFNVYPQIYNSDNAGMCQSVSSLGGGYVWVNGKNFVHSTNSGAHIRLVITTNGQPPAGTTTYRLRGSAWINNAATSPTDYATISIGGQSGGYPYQGYWLTNELMSDGTLTVTNDASGNIKYTFTNVMVYCYPDSAIISGKNIVCQ